jgi:uracil-DNA glycosylase
MLTNISQEWLDIIDKPELKYIEKEVAKITPDDKLCPPKNLWFEWTRLTNLDSIKVIIVGQDPYYDKGTAHGLAFSALGKKIPPSLKNIYACLKNKKLIQEPPNHANLTEWASKGILLINAALSTELGTPAKHSRIWASYIIELMKNLSNYGRNNGVKYVYLLWGNFAQKFKPFIDDTHHDVLEWLHPSPMAQSRAAEERKFINCDHFTTCTELYNIDWSLTSLGSEIESEIESEEKTPRVIECDPMTIQAFTDGSCENNGSEEAIGGFAAIFVGGALKGKKLRGKIATNASNIRAEGKAIICVLERLKKIEIDVWTKAQIFSDSQFWINMLLKFMPKWTSEKFEKQKNPDITKKLWKLWNSFPSHVLEIIYVPAHNKLNWENSADEYERWCYTNNDAVDKLANRARLE